MKNNTPTPPGGRERPSLQLERTYRADIADVWDLWSTSEGIESWWGPEGFTVKVLRLDLRAGGELLYAMTATGSEQVKFMQQVGMPLTTEARITYQEVVPHQRIAYTTLVDFVADTKPYDVRTLVEFQVLPDRVKMVLSFDPMHSEEWTQRAVMGHQGQLGKLDALMRSRGELNERHSAKGGWLRSTGAVFAGILANFVIAVPIDLVLHGLGIYPAPGAEPMTHAQCALALSYRVVAAVVGGWLTARLAPVNPRKHTLILGLIGTAMATAGAIVMWGVGPAWYALAVIAIAIPSSLWGGSLYRDAARVPGAVTR